MKQNSITRGLMIGAVVSMGAGCAVTSPTWDYEPDSISDPIPFTAYTTSTANPVVVECADDTDGHGHPAAGESSYIFAANLNLSTTPMLDSQGSAIYSASRSLALPNTCWEYFSSYGYWQANVRVSQVINGTKRVFSSFDDAGLSCMLNNIAAEGSWFGHLGDGCEKTYSNTGSEIPYIVLRMDGDASGVAKAVSPQETQKSAAPRRDELQPNALPVTPIEPLSPQDQEAIEAALQKGQLPTDPAQAKKGIAAGLGTTIPMSKPVKAPPALERK